MYANFQNVKNSLGQFKNPLNITAVSETRIDVERGADFVLRGYDLHCDDRGSRKGGVALFVDEGFTHQVVDSMSVVVVDVMECITIEISMERTKMCW